MPEAKDRTDVVAQVVAAEGIAMALAKIAIAAMTDVQKAAFKAAVTANVDAICGEMAAQAPVIGKGRGLSPQAANAAAGRIVADAKSLTEAHLFELDL